MGRIPRYQRRQLASSYVGAPQRDVSGAAEAEAVLQAGAPVVDAEVKKLQKIRDTQTDIMANSALVDYSMAFQEEAANLQNTYADDPMSYSDALMDTGNRLASEIAGNIADERVHSKFLTAARLYLKQEAKNAVAWQFEKAEDNAIKGWDMTARKMALQAGRVGTPANMKALLVSLKESIIDMRPSSVPLSVAEEQYTEYATRALEAHLYTRAREEPDILKEELEGENPYEKMPVYTSEMKEKFLKSTETRMRTIRQEQRRAQDDVYQSASLELLAGELTFESIDMLANTDDPYRQLSADKANSLRRALLKDVKRDALSIRNNNKKAEKYVDMVEMFVDDGIKRGRFYEKIVDIWADGSISKDEAAYWTSMKTELEDLKAASERQAVGLNLRKVIDAVQQADFIAEDKTEVAGAVQNMMNYVLRYGASADEAADLAIKSFRKERVIKNDPSLAGLDDPVTEAYRREAIRILQSSGYPVVENNILSVIEQLKQSEK